jgi:hypothetical protein
MLVLLIVVVQMLIHHSLVFIADVVPTTDIRQQQQGRYRLRVGLHSV